MPCLGTDHTIIYVQPQRVASLHIHFILDVEKDTTWIKEHADSSEIKPAVQTRSLQGSSCNGRDSICVKRKSPNWFCWKVDSWCTAPWWSSWEAAGAMVTVAGGQMVGWVCLPFSYWLPGAVGVSSISSSQRGQKSEKQPIEAENEELGFLHIFMIPSWLGLTHTTSMIQIVYQLISVNICSSQKGAEILFTLFYCFAIVTVRHLFQCKYFLGGYCLNEMQATFVLLNIHCHTIWKSQPGFTNWLFFLFTQKERPEYQIIHEMYLSTVLLEQDCCIICELSHGETKRQSCNKSPGKSCSSGDQSETCFIQRQLIYF